MMARKSSYDRFPVCQIRGFDRECWAGWEAITARLKKDVTARHAAIMVVECYPGVHEEQIRAEILTAITPATVIDTKDLMLSPEKIDALVQRDVTDDPVFGYLTSLRFEDFFDPAKLGAARAQVGAHGAGTLLIFGAGASVVSPGDVLVYADLARWEAQMRFRRDEISNLGVDNRNLRWPLQYKRAFFVDWRVADKQKKRVLERIDYLLDTNTPGEPKLVTGNAFREALRQVSRRPFRVVPFFDPAPWGGQWMKKVCDLDPKVENYGWCFDCVPEENSLYLRFGEHRVEVPSIDLVFFQPRELLGDPVHARFGTEFPIRFDFLDTIGGGNLSFQVHPLTEYIQEQFGMHYTQDESYYLLDADEGAAVYLGLRENVDHEKMVNDLTRAQEGNFMFPAEEYVNRWPAKKHDHFLIPAGTVHCSAEGSMVLEISATPYIFTFKMWDWGRMGLDGKPRPVHLKHGVANIQWDRMTSFAERELINQFREVARGDGWVEEHTGLHEREFIETRRHWFTSAVEHHTNGGVNVLNLIEGGEAVVESPTGAFEPFVVHYAETFIIPAAVGAYTIRPHGTAEGSRCGTIKAYVRTKPD